MRLLTLITVPHDPHCSRRLGIACAHWSPLPHCSASKPRVRGDAVGALQRSQQCGYRSSSATWRSTRAPAIPVHRGRDRAHPAPSSHACSCNPQPHATALLRAHLAAGRPQSGVLPCWKLTGCPPANAAVALHAAALAKARVAHRGRRHSAAANFTTLAPASADTPRRCFAPTLVLYVKKLFCSERFVDTARAVAGWKTLSSTQIPDAAAHDESWR
jgi:hypothetical protein